MKLFRAALLLTGLLCLAVGVWAQTQEGRISGRVTDQSGAVVRKAQITVENVATGVKHLVETNSDGEYFASALEPGSYRVSAESPGFKKALSTPILLEVSRAV